MVTDFVMLVIFVCFCYLLISRLLWFVFFYYYLVLLVFSVLTFTCLFVRCLVVLNVYCL